MNASGPPAQDHPLALKRPDFSCAYVTDTNFLPITCFSIISMIETARWLVPVYILVDGVDTASLDKASAYLRSHGANFQFVQIEDAALAHLPLPQSLPRATYGRLLMHTLLPADLNRVLYIDGDTLVDVDVTTLADTALHGNILGAVIDVGRVLIGRREEAQQRLALGPDGDYFNAGMLLIDWPEWRAARVGEICLQALMDDPLRFTQKDQCALNYVCRGRWLPLDLRWNYQPACVVHQDVNAALFHFLGRNKPWQRGQMRHPMRFAKRYEVLYRNSPWAGELKTGRDIYIVRDLVRRARNAISPRRLRTRLIYKKVSAGQEL